MEQSNTNSDIVNKDSVDTENSTVSAGSSSADQRSTTADHSMSATNTSILQTMMEQQTVLLQAIQDMQNSGKATNGETSLVDDQVDENNGAPLSYGLEEVSSEGETSDEDEMMDICKLYDNDDSVGPNVNEKLAQNINISFKKRLSKENQTKISDKFQRPANCDSLTIPKVNIEIWEEANSHLRVKDIHLAKVQSMVNKAAVPIIQMAQKCLDKDKKGINVSQCTDALVLLASAATELTQVRRESLKPAIPGQYKHRLCSSDNEPSTKYLFGDDLGKKMKEIKDSKAMAGKFRDSGAGRFKPYPKKGGDFRKGKFPDKRPFLGKHQKSWPKAKGDRQ